MDQSELRAVEARCIEENPPWCVAACPLHLDARALAARVAERDWVGAWKIIARSMPLPGVLARICDAPCGAGCKRAEAGGAIDIHGLERACAEHAPPSRGPVALPPRSERILIIGAGLAGLSAAWHAALKGYRVTIHEPGPRLAHGLRDKIGGLVPAEVLDAELAVLDKLKVRVELNSTLDAASLPTPGEDGCDAVFLSLDALAPTAWPLAQGPDSQPVVPSPAQTTALEGVFAGGLERDDGPSPVWRAAEGRWAATSIQRYLQGVSPTVNRDRDTPYATRLFTSLEGVEDQPPVTASGQVFTPEEAAREAARCMQCHCLQCVKVCPYLEHYGAYPKKYAREIYNNLSIVMGDHHSNKLINSCSLCGLCTEVCPEDFSMADLCLTARRDMVRSGKMPPSAHDFALLDMEFSLGPDFRLARLQPGTSTSAALFFPGCQLAASNPAQVKAVYEHLCSALPNGVGLMLSCCGAPAHWAGQEQKTAEVIDGLQEDWRALGSPRLIMGCPSCADVFSRYLPDAPRVMMWQVLADTLGDHLSAGGQYAVHDPCTTRHDPATQSALRRLLERAGVELSELGLGRELTECCGYGGLMDNAHPALANKTLERRSGQSPLDYLTYCAVCRDRLAKIGKRAVHALDLLFPRSGGDDPAARPSPGWSQRRENRARLKADLLRGLWKEETPEMEAQSQIKLLIGPEVAALLEERRILTEDLQKVIMHAEDSGDKLTHPATGHSLASFRPYKATFWVEYSAGGDGFVVHNAYAHRMVPRVGGRS